MIADDSIQCAVAAGDICGEGAVWHPKRAALYWVDIDRFLVHEFIPEPQTTRTWFFEEPVTSVNLTEDEEVFLLVFASRIGLWSLRTHPKIETIFHLDAFPEMRFGVPDGSAMDSEGFLWNTRPGAGCLIRIAPDERVDRIVPLSVERPTTCAFGGARLETLYITSARSKERLSGSVFAFTPGVAGVPAGRFRIE